MSNTDKYNDIINLPHHVSPNRNHMSMIDRAAQFSPFAALTGHSEAIDEVARFTENAPFLDENTKDILNEKLQLIAESLNNEPVVSITFFRPDTRKSGGAYIIKNGTVKNIDSFNRELYFADNTHIPIDSIIEIDGRMFNSY
ncbi:MAG: hypothetical protein IKV76_07425 [Clostridia bacterium]|nr:hypothetical protein [Clostridia bacterium]